MAAGGAFLLGAFLLADISGGGDCDIKLLLAVNISCMAMGTSVIN